MGHPFFAKRFKFKQPDGFEFQVIGWGNDTYAVFETESGHTIFRDEDTRIYSYANIGSDTGQFVSSAYIVGQDDLFAMELETHLRESRKAVATQQKQKGCDRVQSQWLMRRTRGKELGDFGPLGTTDPQAGFASGQIHGSIVGLCIPIDFEDDQSIFTTKQISDFCNLRGYSEFGNAGSVRDYFLDVSLERFDYSNLVTPVYRAKKKKTYYTDPLVGGKKKTAELIKEALDYFLHQGFDFSTVDVDDNGSIYALNVFYAGAVDNTYDEGLWPHQSSLRIPVNIGAGNVIDYQITNMDDQLVIGTFCHETGHLLCGFPDLYDASLKSAGVGVYCLMGLGGIIDERNPAHPCAYLKFEAGWFGPTEGIVDGSPIHLTPGDNSMAFFMRDNQEYLVIEHRTSKGRDSVLPSTGIAIWHVDTRQENNESPFSDPDEHYLCALLQADGQFHLERYTNKGDDQDLFGQNGFDAFPNEAAGMVANWWDGTPTGLNLRNITSDDNGTIFKVLVDDGDLAV